MSGPICQLASLSCPSTNISRLPKFAWICDSLKADSGGNSSRFIYKISDREVVQRHNSGIEEGTTAFVCHDLCTVRQDITHVTRSASVTSPIWKGRQGPTGPTR